MKNFWRLPIYHIYLLQLENYDLTRVWRGAVRDGVAVPETFRGKITWTAKLSLVTALAVLLSLTVGVGASFVLPAGWTGWGISVLLLIAFFGWFVLPLSIATLLVRPLDRVIRWHLKRKARDKIKSLTDLTVIGITGSYGKTTMKQTMKTMLSDAKHVAATPESFNKPVSVARFVLSEVSADTDALIVEMGAYQVGDIADLCNLTQPDISVLTGINEAHRERFGSLENTIQAKFEIVTHAKADAPIILNADDDQVVENHKKYVGDHEAYFYSAANHQLCEFTIKDKRFHTDGSGISFRLYQDDKELGYTKVAHLGEYIIGNVIAGVIAGQQLEVEPQTTLESAAKITPAKRRLQPIQRTSSNILVIDDSYNGTSDGVKAALETLDKFVGRRKVCVTTGLVEIGDESERIHKTIGRQLADVADVVVLVESSVTDWLKAGLEANDFAGELHVLKNQEVMQEQISNLTVAGDVVLFQNDWSENYR